MASRITEMETGLKSMLNAQEQLAAAGPVVPAPEQVVEEKPMGVITSEAECADGSCAPRATSSNRSSSTQYRTGLFGNQRRVIFPRLRSRWN